MTPPLLLASVLIHYTRSFLTFMPRGKSFSATGFLKLYHDFFLLFKISIKFMRFIRVTKDKSYIFNDLKEIINNYNQIYDFIINTK
jgi:hypothetical protein